MELQSVKLSYCRLKAFSPRIVDCAGYGYITSTTICDTMAVFCVSCTTATKLLDMILYHDTGIIIKELYMSFRCHMVCMDTKCFHSYDQC